MKKMRLSLNKKDIINLLSNTGKLSAKEFYKKLDKIIKRNIDHKLFTLTVVDRSIKYVERVYSNNTKIYPLLGTKPIPKNSWTNKVINNKKYFFGESKNQIKKLFFDYEKIFSLGCGSIINIPIINDKKILGTLNILHKEKFYTIKSVKMIQPYAQLLSPYFILHQLKMKKKKR